MRIGQAAADAIARPYGTEFEVGNIVDLLYPASGGSTDWYTNQLLKMLMN